MTTAKISCIDKSDRLNPHERITHVGGPNADGTRWRMSQPDAIAWLELPGNRFYVEKNSYHVEVIIRISRYGHKYLTTEADGEAQNNLLSLPECPR